MKTRIITARVDNYVNAEIEFLKSSLRLPNTTSVLTYAIHNLYETIKEEESQKSSLEMFEEKGLLGCFEGSPDLSTNYKNIISEVIDKKQSRLSARRKPGTRKTGKK